MFDQRDDGCGIICSLGGGNVTMHERKLRRMKDYRDPQTYCKSNLCLDARQATAPCCALKSN